MALDRDERTALRRIVYDEERVTTDLRPETLAEKVAALRPRLIETATAGETAGYGEVTDDFAVVHGARVGTVLAAAGLLEADSGRPLLPAVVVEADSGLPGEWFFELLDSVERFDERLPDGEAGRRAVWSTQIMDVWQHPWG